MKYSELTQCIVSNFDFGSIKQRDEMWRRKVSFSKTTQSMVKNLSEIDTYFSILIPRLPTSRNPFKDYIDIDTELAPGLWVNIFLSQNSSQKYVESKIATVKTLFSEFRSSLSASFGRQLVMNVWYTDGDATHATNGIQSNQRASINIQICLISGWRALHDETAVDIFDTCVAMAYFPLMLEERLARSG